MAFFGQKDVKKAKFGGEKKPNLREVVSRGKRKRENEKKIGKTKI